MTTQQMLDGAACYDACIAPGQRLAALIYLASLILENGNLP